MPSERSSGFASRAFAGAQRKKQARDCAARPDPVMFIVRHIETDFRVYCLVYRRRLSEFIV